MDTSNLEDHNQDNPYTEYIHSIYSPNSSVSSYSPFLSDLIYFDSNLQKWLTARDNNLYEAIDFFQKSLNWRIENQIDNIFYEEFPRINEIKESYPHGFHKFDKDGRPIYLERTGDIQVDKLFSYINSERLLRLHMLHNEYVLHYLFRKGSYLYQKDVHQMFVIIDLQNLGLSQICTKVLSYLSNIAVIDQNNYPEMMGKVFIINAPWVFQIAWKVIQPLLDPRTKRKIQILNNNFLEDLVQYIEFEDIPDFLGGGCKCPGGCMNGSDEETLCRAVTATGSPSLLEINIGDSSENKTHQIEEKQSNVIFN